MKFTALQNSSAVLAVLVASSAFASMTTLTASNITGTGLYFQDPTIWSIQFTFDGALTQTSLNGDFGNWTLTVNGSNGSSWSKSNNETDGGSFNNFTNGRIYNVILGDGFGGSQGTMAVDPEPSILSLRYSTQKIAGVYMSLGEALAHSTLSSLPPNQQGRISVTHVDGEGKVDGEIWGTFAVPAPGTAALIGLAGMISSRRRRN